MNFFNFLLVSDENKSTSQKPDDSLVSAGDPAKPLASFVEDVYLSSDDKRKLQGLRRFKVCGSSMSPCGIDNGDLIYVDNPEGALRCNDFIVVKVDDQVYETPVLFAHKLRRYLMDVTHNESFDDVVRRLKEFHKDIMEPEFQQRLRKKFNKTKSFYPYDDLCLSITFRNGDLRYSFHPKRLVEYKVFFSISIRNQTLVDVSCIAAY